MKIILSNFCTSLAGMINPELGYFVVPRKGAFYAVRSKWGAPPNGHWRFIRTCAEMTLNGLYIADIRVSRSELREALLEANYPTAASNLRLPVYSAQDILNIQIT